MGSKTRRGRSNEAQSPQPGSPPGFRGPGAAGLVISPIEICDIQNEKKKNKQQKIVLNLIINRH
jgi:hypothetical protein